MNLERAYSVIEVMDGIAKARSNSVARVALAWLLHQPHVTTIVIGAKTAEQLEDNLAVPELKLSAEELAALETASALPPEYPGLDAGLPGQESLALAEVVGGTQPLREHWAE